MKTYKGFNVVTNQPVGYFTKEEAELMTRNPVYKSISFINETPKSDEKEENAKTRDESEKKQADADKAKETIVGGEQKKKSKK